MSLSRYIEAAIPSHPLARSFIVLSLSLGSLYAAINPPFAVNDERHHWARVMEISKGRIKTRTDADGPHHFMPKDYYDLIMRYAEVQRAPDWRVNAADIVHDLTTPAEAPARWRRRVANASGYSPVSYIPQIPAVWLARILRLPPLWHIYLARWATLAFYCLITSWAIAYAGELGLALFVLALMPMSLTQAAGLSGDGVALVTCFSFFALIARGTFGGSQLPKRELVSLLVLCGVLPLCRPPYLLLAGALLAITWEGPRARLNRWLFMAAGLAVSIATLFLWTYLNRDAATSGTDPMQAQLAWIRAHPREMLTVLSNTLIERFDDNVIQFVAVRDVIHHQMRFFGGLLAALYLPLLGAVTWGASCRAVRANRGVRASVSWIALSGLASVGAVVLAMYLASTSTGRGTISGIQGRYFIPVAPAFLLPLSVFGSPSLGRWLAKRNGVRLRIALVSLNLLTVLALLARYYGPPEIDWPY